ncbi:MAG: sulfite exporter TauE/SafE family protein [Chloroflexi bacterium]|nr:sulfite exporter TauE/SafE family protein [Chloroflexota bacterium]
MSLALGVAVMLLSFGGGAVSGLLGISGAVVMVPVLLYVPPWLGLGQLSVKSVAAIAIVQGLFASSSGVVAHRSHGYVNGSIAIIGGMFVAIGALTGGILSRWAPDVLLLTVFALAATLGFVLMVVSGDGVPVPETGFEFRRPWRLGVFFPEGLMAGMVGVGGGFLITPVLHRIFGVPLRVAIASALAMSWFGAMAGSLGKVATGQVPLLLSVVVVVGAIPGAQLGALVNGRLSRRFLRYLYAVLLVLIALSMWWEVLRSIGVV